MTNELKSLTWKYFWQQKLKEIIIVLLMIVGVIFIPYLVGSLIPDHANMFILHEGVCFIEKQIDCGLGFWEHWFQGFVIVFFGGIIIGLIIKGIYEWIKSNWKKADGRARDELEISQKLEEDIY